MQRGHMPRQTDGCIDRRYTPPSRPSRLEVHCAWSDAQAATGLSVSRTSEHGIVPDRRLIPQRDVANQGRIGGDKDVGSQRWLRPLKGLQRAVL